MSIVSYNKASLSYLNLAYLCIMYAYCLSVRFKRTKDSSRASFLPYLAFSCRSSYSGVFKKKISTLKAGEYLNILNLLLIIVLQFLSVFIMGSTILLVKILV